MNDLYVMTPLEVARGYLVGRSGELADSDESGTPRQVLERVIQAALQRAPCAVAFSGGRDSSLLLAVAAHVARREGLELPIPVTRVFPALPETDELEWQTSVVRRIGLPDWQRLEFGNELDVVGPYAQRHLREHGVVWPAALATSVPIFELVRGGTMLDGEGGDEVLGHEAHRIGPIADLARRPRPLRRSRLRCAIEPLCPTPMRRRRARADRDAQPLTWLRPEARRSFVDDLTADRVDRPLPYSASVRQMPQRRTQLHSTHNRQIVARLYDVELRSPLLESSFVQAMARHGGRLGPGDRTVVLRSMAGTLLPDDVIIRRSKAVFNRAYITETARTFAERWSGAGVDTELVDPEALRAAWLAERPHWMSATLLQAAWLADAKSESTNTQGRIRNNS